MIDLPLPSSRVDFQSKKFIIISIAFHFLFISIFIFSKGVKKHFWGDDRPQLIEEIIRVDIVGLPKLTLSELNELKKELDNDKSSVDVKKQASINEDDDKSISKNLNEIESTSESGLDIIRNLSVEKGVLPGKISVKKRKKNIPKGYTSKKLKNLI